MQFFASTKLSQWFSSWDAITYYCNDNSTHKLDQKETDFCLLVKILIFTRGTARGKTGYQVCFHIKVLLLSSLFFECRFSSTFRATQKTASSPNFVVLSSREKTQKKIKAEEPTAT